ncbi:succinylglutamate desuccinylase/aspartoacylase family protein [Paenibacillus sp. FSL K6-1318]|uniref:succinylglutamate desuccinylase/aspartoacylase domain-containing protein n=1 Tax=Paenibacillus sp. FSL K6-1318 TaxID=2975291 RepID=UPI0030EBA6B7
MQQTSSETPCFAATHYVFDNLEEAFAQQPVATVSRINETYEEQSIILFLVKGYETGPSVWIQAALHGDEHDGIVACARLLADVSSEDLRGNLIVCPVTNPTAMLAGTNASPLDGINLNRVFGQNVDPASYSSRYGQWLADHITKYADFLIDLHGGGRWLDVCPFAMVASDHDGAFNRSMAALSQVPLTATFICRDDAKGMLINEVCKKGIPAVLLESGGGNRWTDTAVHTHFHSIRLILDQLGAYSADAQQKECGTYRANCKPLQIREIAELRFVKSGILTFSRQAGDVVRQGEELIRVLSYPELEEHSIICPIAHGVILSIHAASTVHNGGYAVMLGKLT